jgi:Tfp pilus assembly protein PilN
MDTQGLYLRQGSLGPIKKVFLIGSGEDTAECLAALTEKMLVPVEILSPAEGVLGIIKKAQVGDFPGRAWGLAGFVYKLPGESLNLLPAELKEIKLKTQQARQRLKLAVFAGLTVVLTVFSLFRQIDNKKAYLRNLDNELARVRPRAEKLETMSRRLNLLGNKNTQRAEILDFLSAIHKVIPPGIVLTGVKYDSQRQEKFSLRGYSEKMELIFSYASALQGLAGFSDEEVKVKYATSKTAGKNEVVQFEIVFLRKE